MSRFPEEEASRSPASAAARGRARVAWRELYERYRVRDRGELSPDEFDLLADAAWWSCSSGEAIAARRDAYAGHAAAGRNRRAARAAWWLFSEHLYRGEQAVALGWLRRSHRHLQGEEECPERGLLTTAEAELALHRGDLPATLDNAVRAVELGSRLGDEAVSAMGLQLQGRALIGTGAVAEGVAHRERLGVGRGHEIASALVGVQHG